MSRPSAPRALEAALLWSLALAGLALAGCAAQQKAVGELWSDWTGSPGASGKGPAVYWTAVGDLKVYAEPRVSSDVVAVLPLHQKVYRDAVDRGFAHVVAEGGGKTGWVDNAKLTWKVPGGGSAAFREAAAPADAAETRPPASAEETAEAAIDAPAAPATVPAAANQASGTAATSGTADAGSPGAAQPADADAPAVNPTVFDPF